MINYLLGEPKVFLKRVALENIFPNKNSQELGVVSIGFREVSGYRPLGPPFVLPLQG